jgi:hypothetical protein
MPTCSNIRYLRSETTTTTFIFNQFVGVEKTNLVYQIQINKHINTQTYIRLLIYLRAVSLNISTYPHTYIVLSDLINKRESFNVYINR